MKKKTKYWFIGGTVIVIIIDGGGHLALYTHTQEAVNEIGEWVNSMIKL